MTFMVSLQMHSVGSWAPEQGEKQAGVKTAICILCPFLIFCILIKSVVSVAIQSHKLARNTVRSQQCVKWYFKINGRGPGAARGYCRAGR